MTGVVRLVGLLGALLIGVLVGLPVETPSGARVLWGEWQVTVSPLGAWLGLIVLWIGTYVATDLVVKVAAAPGELAVWRSGRRSRAVERRLSNGLLRLAEGRYAEAATALDKAARAASPTTSQRLTGSIAAAYAAHRLGDHASLARHLQRAVEGWGEPLAGLGRAVAARLDGDHEEARRVLAETYRRDPANHEVALHLAVSLAALERWDELEPVIGRLRRLPSLASFSRPFQVALASARMHRARAPRELHALWSKLDHAERARGSLLAAYVRGMLSSAADLDDELTRHLEEVVRSALDHAWSDELVELYAQIPAHAPRRLARLEAWLAGRPEDPGLLRAAGTVCVGQKLWGKARSFLRASAELAPCARTCFELAALERALGEPAAASAWTERGVRACLDRSGGAGCREAASATGALVPWSRE